jgi:hypothetical protein
MRKTKVKELMGQTSISISSVPKKISEKFPILKTLSFALLSNALNMNGHNLRTNGKLDYCKIYNFLKKEPRWKKGPRETQEMINIIAPLVGIVKELPVIGKERSELKTIEKAYRNPNLDYDYFKDSEIPEEMAEDEDYVVRLDFGEVPPAFYRLLDENGNAKSLLPEEGNMLRMVFALEHGCPERGTYGSYLGAVPAKVGFIRKHGRRFDRTRVLESPDIIEKMD